MLELVRKGMGRFTRQQQLMELQGEVDYNSNILLNNEYEYNKITNVHNSVNV